MALTKEERAQLSQQLEDAKAKLKGCLGGIDPDGCVEASREIARLRIALRDDATLFTYFASLAAREPRRGRRRKAA